MDDRMPGGKWLPLLIATLALHFSITAGVAWSKTLEAKGRVEKGDACGSIIRPTGKPRPVALEDYDCVTDLSEAKVSKNGKYVAYIAGGILHIRDVDTNKDWEPPLDSADDSSWSPVWSENVLYFLSGASDLTKIWKVSAETGQNPIQLGCVNFELEALKLSGDGSRLLMELARTPSKVDIGASGAKDGAATANCVSVESENPAVITGVVFKEDGTGYVEKEKRVYAFDLSEGTITQLTDKSDDGQAASHDTDATWSPDGSEVAFIREYPSKLEYSSELWKTSARPLHNSTPIRLANSLAERRSPSWSPDGKFIAYLSSDSRQGPYAIGRLAIYSLEDGTEKILTRHLDRMVIAFHFSESSDFIYFIYASEGGQHLARVRASGGSIEYLLHSESLISAIDVDRHNHVYMIMNAINDTPDLHVMNAEGSLKRMTFLNDQYLKSIRLAPRVKMSIRHRDGSHFEAFITKPADFDASRKYPAVLNLHGGPIDDQHHYGYDFFSQYLAANGYVVVEPNAPGSLGRGQKQNLEIKRNWGCTDYPKVLLAIDRLIAVGTIDPQRLAVTGYSYGGFMTNCIITKTPRKFKAAASGAGHSSIAANFGHDEWVKWYKWELGVPWTNRDRYDRLSPLVSVEKVKTPTLFLGGAEDWNAPILNSELFYQALRARGVASQLVVYGGSGHSGWGSEFDKDYYRRILEWFNDHLNCCHDAPHSLRHQ